MKRITFNSLFAITAISLSASAAASTITNLDLASASPFGGFDWSSNGTAISTPGPVYGDGSIVTTYFWADAVSIKQEGGGNFTTPGLLAGAPGTSFGAGQYEYTILASLTETISGCGLICDVGESAIFTTTGGSWDIFYDHSGLASTVANQISGSGFTDGATLMSGTVDAGGGGIFFVTAGGLAGGGFFSFSGDVTSTNAAYITPDQDNTVAFSTLQFGLSTTGWTTPTSTPLGGLPGSYIAFQADANQDIHAIPEPGILALLGLGMIGLFATSQKKRA